MSSCGCSNDVLVGSIPTVELTFTDVNGDPADPSTLAIRLLRPDGTTADYTHASPEVDNPTVGTWTWRPTTALDQAGVWWLYAQATGGGVDRAVETSFSLGDSHVPLPS